MSSGMGIGRRVAKAKQLTQVSRAGLCNASRLQRKRAQRGEKGNGVGGREWWGMMVGESGGRKDYYENTDTCGDGRGIHPRTRRE